MCPLQNITCDVEEIDGSYVNTAMDRLVKNDVHYRYSLQSVHCAMVDFFSCLNAVRPASLQLCRPLFLTVEVRSTILLLRSHLCPCCGGCIPELLELYFLMQVLDQRSELHRGLRAYMAAA